MSPKKNLRSQLLDARRALSPEQKVSDSQKIIERLTSHLGGTPPAHILCYRATPDEVATVPLFNQPPARIYAPRMLPGHHMEWVEVTPQTGWLKGAFNIDEPKEGNCWAGEEYSVLVCPMAGFDRQGHRLGMGMGFFDRWLEKHRHSISEIIGLAFSCQEADEIPADAHDIPMHTIITEVEVISCQTR